MLSINKLCVNRLKLTLPYHISIKKIVQQEVIIGTGSFLINYIDILKFKVIIKISLEIVNNKFRNTTTIRNEVLLWILVLELKN